MWNGDDPVVITAKRKTSKGRKGCYVQFIHDLIAGNRSISYSGAPCRALAQRAAVRTPGSGGDLRIRPLCGICPVCRAVYVSCEGGNPCQGVRPDPSRGSGSMFYMVPGTDEEGWEAPGARPAHVVRSERFGGLPRRELWVPCDGPAPLQAG